MAAPGERDSPLGVNSAIVLLAQSKQQISELQTLLAASYASQTTAERSSQSTIRALQEQVQRQNLLLDWRRGDDPRRERETRSLHPMRVVHGNALGDDPRRERETRSHHSMRVVHGNAFKTYSGIPIPAYHQFTDGSQCLTDWTSTLSNVFTMSNIPECLWPKCLLVHLSGPALQEFRTLQRDRPNITFREIVDAFKKTFGVFNEQGSLRATIMALKLSDFPDLGRFVAEYKRLLSYVDKSSCPSDLVADWLVTSLANSPAAESITLLTLTNGCRPPLTELLAALTTLAQIGSSSKIIPMEFPQPLSPPQPPRLSQLASRSDWSGRPKPVVQVKRKAFRPCALCQGLHYDKDCPERLVWRPRPQSTLQRAASPGRPEEHLEGTHKTLEQE